MTTNSLKIWIFIYERKESTNKLWNDPNLVLVNTKMPFKLTVFSVMDIPATKNTIMCIRLSCNTNKKKMKIIFKTKNDIDYSIWMYIAFNKTKTQICQKK